MGPKQKGGGQKQKGNAAEEVEETLQAVVCFLGIPGFRLMLTEGIGSGGYLRDPIRAIYAGQTTGMSGKKSFLGYKMVDSDDDSVFSPSPIPL